MKQLTIITDMDDVLENFCETWIKINNAKFNRCVRHKDITEWELSKNYPDIESHLLWECVDKESFWKLVKPIENAAEATRELVSEGHNVYVATASSTVTAVFKAEHVMRRLFPHIPLKNLIVINDKSLLRGDVMIDDNPHNLGGDFGTKILFTAPHNRAFRAAENGFLRADDWRTVYKIINEVSGKW